ncbi:MAG TPA: glycoside hydrolase family 16 protein [Nocardioidaceae bacterium]|nr:glycoside hydrolase family 16 protein [Nocardioidaceae bacterium]
MAVLGLLAAVCASCTDASPTHQDARRPAEVRGLELRVLPPVAQSGPRAAEAGSARSVLVAAASPGTSGALVTLQRRSGATWKDISSAVTDRNGLTGFLGPREVAPGEQYRVVSAADPMVRSAGPVVGDWRLDFSDEFDGSSLGRAWSYRQLGELSKTSGRTFSASAKEAVAVADGVLRLQVAEDPDTSGHFLNGHISTEKSYQFRHGVAAARIKFQRPRGSHGAFWSQSPTAYSHPGDPAKAGTEIDVAEYFGDGYPGGGLASYVHHVDKRGENVKDGDVLPAAVRAVGSSDAFWRRYHVYSVEWSPEGYVFRIDGKATFATDRAVSQRSQYLILSLLSSDWELPDLDERLLPGVMEVDWVRVWQPRA